MQGDEDHEGAENEKKLKAEMNIGFDFCSLLA